MDTSELETYKYQLSQVELALAKDPSSSELLNLKQELTNLIDLTVSYLSTQKQQQQSGTSSSSALASASSPSVATPTLASSPSRSSPAASAKAGAKGSVGNGGGKDTPTARAASPVQGTVKFAAGDEVQAKYSGDGRWYPAKVISVSGSEQAPVYSIIFKGYNNTEVVNASSLRPNTGGADKGKKRAAGLTPEEEAEKEKRRKKNEKKAESRATKSQEMLEKQNAWAKFAKKKATIVPGVSGKSMFKTGDEPGSRVGVVGSGRGMSETKARKRHIFGDE